MTGEPVTPAAREWFIRTSVKQYHKGIGKYPTELTTFNGRDALEDAAQEGADLWHYLAQAKLERDADHKILIAWLQARAKVEIEVGASKSCYVDEYLIAEAALERVARRVVG